MFHLEVRGKSYHKEAGVMGLSAREDHMIVACNFDTIPACDRWTDGRIYYS